MSFLPHLVVLNLFSSDTSCSYVKAVLALLGLADFEPPPPPPPEAAFSLARFFLALAAEMGPESPPEPKIRANS